MSKIEWIGLLAGLLVLAPFLVLLALLFMPADPRPIDYYHPNLKRRQ